MHQPPPESSGRIDKTLLRRGGLLFSALLAGAVVLGACGSSSSGTNTTAPPTTPTTSGTGTTAPSGGGTPTTAAASGAAALSNLASKLQTGEASAYDAVYKNTGGSNLTSIEIAEQPPSSFAFKTTGSSGVSEVIGTSKGIDACNQSSGSSTWTCVNLGTSLAATYEEATQLFTGKYWAGLLETYKADAAAAGVHVTTSSMTAAGVPLQCVTYTGGAVKQGGEVCVTAQGALGYVHSFTTNEVFQLSSYSTSPSASLFQPPAGATVQTIPGGTLPGGGTIP